MLEWLLLTLFWTDLSSYACKIQSYTAAFVKKPTFVFAHKIWVYVYLQLGICGFS